MEIIQKFIYLPHNMGPEFRVPLQMELSFAPLSSVAEPSPYVIAVYRYFNRNMPFNECVYKFDGVRIVGPPNKSGEQDVALCEDCGENPVMNGCSVCAECGL